MSTSEVVNIDLESETPTRETTGSGGSSTQELKLQEHMLTEQRS
jgi:hypothetical protein